MYQKWGIKIRNFLEKYSKPLGITLLVGSVIVLLGTSLYIGYKSGVIQTNNHDNLIDNYMFESPETFKESLFPAAHTFLMKWPMFALSAALGNSPQVYIAGAIILYTLTILGFLFVIFMLTKRNPLITAFSALVLSNILLMIPPQPIDGALLPLNMAMITTRNIEFLLLFAFIYLVLRSKKITSIPFIFATLALTLLGASDKLFLMTGLVSGALYIAYIYSPFGKRLRTRSDSKITPFLPLISASLSYILATIILTVIVKFDITRIPDVTNTAPFELIGSMWQFFEAIAGALQATIANFGAGFFGKPLGVSTGLFAINGLFLLLAIYSLYLLFFKKKTTIDFKKVNKTSLKFAFWLLLAYASAFLLFVASDHQYTIDGRYLTSALFAGITGIALMLKASPIRYKNTILIIACVALAILTPAYLLSARNTFSRATDATQTAIGNSTDKIAQILKESNAQVFAANYWLASPVRLKTNNSITPVLMSEHACNTPNTFLTSKQWYAPSNEVRVSALSIRRDVNTTPITFNNGCSPEYLNSHFGEQYTEHILLSDDAGLPLDIIRIYPYDIRQKIGKPSL